MVAVGGGASMNIRDDIRHQLIDYGKCYRSSDDLGSGTVRACQLI